MGRRLIVVGILVLPATAFQAQAQTRRTLGAPDGSVAHDFSHIQSIRELPDKRVLVSDDRDRAVFLADFTGKTAEPRGRQGGGPLEFRQPGSFLAMPEGRTLLLDPGNARFLEFAPDGAITGSVVPRGAKMLSLTAAWDSRGTDVRGRVYFEQLPGPLRPGQWRIVPIVRWDPGTVAMDTVASYTLREDMMSPAAAERGTDIILRPRAWAPRPQWSVGPEGRIAMVEPAPYRVRWSMTSGWTVGTAVTWEPIRVSEEDRAAFKEGWETGPRGPSGPPEQRPAGSKPPQRKRAGEPIYPETMPPFSGRDAVRVGPDGVVWVARTRSVTDSIPIYDLFDARGLRTAQVVFPPRTRLVGFGSGVLYLARKDTDDLEHLERVPWR